MSLLHECDRCGTHTRFVSRPLAEVGEANLGVNSPYEVCGRCARELEDAVRTRSTDRD